MTALVYPCFCRCVRVIPTWGLQDNDVEREAAVHRTEGDYAKAETWKWVLAATIGATMGALAFCVDWGIDSLNNAKFSITAQHIRDSGALAHLGAAGATTIE